MSSAIETLLCIEPPVLYSGPVVHLRHEPRRLFKYRLWMLAIDLDDMDALARRSRLFRHNRLGIISIYDRDHGARDGTKLRSWVEQALASHDLSSFTARLRFIAMPRLFGYAFNPISFYFCYNMQNQLGAILYQVKNTFGDQITYLISPPPNHEPARHTVQKKMHVSPFFDMQGFYDFTTDLRPDRFTVAIAYRAEAKRLTVQMQLAGSPFSSGTLLKLLITFPLTTLKIIIAIHWQALRLFMRGIKFHGEPVRGHDTIFKAGIS